jgi:urease accessory protein
MNKNIPTRIVAAIACAAFATTAFAHPGHNAGHGAFVAGLLHPWTGADHLLAMIVVGIWAAQLGGRAIFAVPASFLAVMTLGAILAIDGIAPPAIEAGIAASLLALGLLVVWAKRLPVAAAMGLTGLFALFHGAAHGSELPELADPALYAAGFLAATAMLHALGVAMGLAMQHRAPQLARAAGAATALAGVAFLLG